MHRSSPILLLAVAGALALSGCASASAPAASPAAQVTPSPTVAPVAQTPSPAAPGATTETPQEIACADLIPESTVAAFTELGWTVQQQEFRLGAEPVADGFQCLWADFRVESDHGQLFGWAPLDATAASEAQAALVQDGWLRVDDPDGFYLTVDPMFALDVDEDGYGTTYQFGDGWVTVADTKQNLLLIERPSP